LLGSNAAPDAREGDEPATGEPLAGEDCADDARGERDFGLAAVFADGGVTGYPAGGVEAAVVGAFEAAEGARDGMVEGGWNGEGDAVEADGGGGEGGGGGRLRFG
jgi:hypothetical protein